MCTCDGFVPGGAQLCPRVVGKDEVVHHKVTELFIIAAIALDLVILKCHEGSPTLGNLVGIEEHYIMELCVFREHMIYV